MAIKLLWKTVWYEEFRSEVLSQIIEKKKRLSKLTFNPLLWLWQPPIHDHMKVDNTFTTNLFIWKQFNLVYVRACGQLCLRTGPQMLGHPGSAERWVQSVTPIVLVSDSCVLLQKVLSAVGFHKNTWNENNIAYSTAEISYITFLWHHKSAVGAFEVKL